MTFKHMLLKWVTLSLLTLSTFNYANSELRDIIKNREGRTSSLQETLHNESKASPHLGLAFVFSSTCSFCQQFAPTLEAFAAKNELPVYPFSADGNGIHTYQAPLIANQEILSAFFPNQQDIVYPALFLVNLDTKAHVPLSIGNVPFNVLETTYQASLTYPHLQARLNHE